MGSRKGMGCTSKMEGWWPRGLSRPQYTGKLLAGKVHGSTLCWACNVSKRDLIFTACDQTEGQLALCYPAHRPVGGPNDQRNSSGWACLGPEESLQPMQKDGGPQDSHFHSEHVAWG